MIIKLTLTVLFAVMTAVVSLDALKNRKIKEPVDWLSLFSLFLCMVSLITTFFHNSQIYLRAFTFISFSLNVFLVRVSSIWEMPASLKMMACIIGVQMLLCLADMVVLSGVVEDFSFPVHLVMLIINGLSVYVLFTTGLLRRVRNMRKLMESGTVWAMLGLGIDAVYSLSVMLAILLAFSLFVMSGSYSVYLLSALCVSAALLQAALVIRLVSGSMFVVMRKREDKILESLKISQLEVMSGSRPETYKEIYDRLLEYFEKERPYLKHDLTINEVAKAIYSNKLYISRAVNLHTGRNFCQFVNYYRITYAIELFRNSPDLKVTAMSAMSGFSCVVSFNTAFKLFMQANPGDWCRKERTKISQKKK